MGNADELTKPIIRTPEQKSELAAWVFVDAAFKLFPELENELDASCERELDGLDPYELGPDDPDEEAKLLEPLRSRVGEWAAQHRISSPLIEDVLLKRITSRRFSVAGLRQTGPEPFVGVFVDADMNLLIDVKPITANPMWETLDDFLRRARAHYNHIKQLHIDLNLADDEDRPRQLEHFGYLAAHLIKGYSWAELGVFEDGLPPRVQLNLRRRSPAAIASGARSVAGLLGIRLRKLPGPQPGGRRHPARPAPR
jgi:hypothetical protein